MQPQQSTQQNNGVTKNQYKISLEVESLNFLKMILDYKLHIKYTSKERLKKMLNGKQVSIAGRFKDIGKNIIFIENKKAMKAFIFCPKKS